MTQKDILKKEANDIINLALSEKREMTDEEQEKVNKLMAEIRACGDSKDEEERESEEEETKPEEEERAEDSEEKETEDENEETKPEDEKPEDEEERSEESESDENVTEDEDNNDNNKNKRNISKTIMEKRFSLVKELRSALETGKKVNLAEIENRAYTVGDEGEDVVQTDIYDIWEPLRAKNVLVQAGAQTITGIKNNVQIPLMGACQAYFASETGASQDGSGAFTSKKLSPKRITAKYPVSLQLLAQDSIGVENAIRADIQKAINSKLEATLLGSAAGDDDKPEGLFHIANSADTLTEISTFANVTDFEAKVEAENFDGGKYIISPKAKAALRNMAKSAKSTQLVMENGAIDGTDAFVTTHVADKNVIYGDFSNLVIATWDNVELDVVRDVASVGNGVVTIVVNAFVDAAVIRPKALVKGKIVTA